MIEVPENAMCLLEWLGDFDQLEFRDIPVPTPVTERRLIKVGTAAVNNTFSLYYKKPNEINRLIIKIFAITK
jgi:hypothetical protein